MNLYSANGHSLVLSERAAQLKTVPGDADSARTRLMLDIHGKQVEMSESTLGSGEIAGLLRFRDQDLLAVQASLGRMAAAFAGAYNAQQARGLDANGKRGQAMFEVGKPVVQAADHNTGGAKLEVSVLDTSKLKAADYRLSYDGSVYQLEDVVSKSRREFAQMPIEVDGLSIRQTSGAMAAGDSMMIQAGTAYAGRMRSVLRDGSAIASSDVMTVNGSSANKGFTTVKQLAEDEEGKGGLDPVKVTFTANNRYRVEVNGNAVGAEKEFEPDKPFDVEANGWTLTLSGRPAMGDVVEMKKRSAPRQDNANAREMTLLADRHNVDGATFSQAFASLLSDVGSRALQAKTSEKASAKMLEGAKTVLANRSGVNLDEEAARLLQYRQAYQAAAKVIQTADEMFNSILALAR